jgi:peroxiredoxin
MALTHTPAPEIGTAIADFRLPATDGRTLSLADVRGARGTLVMFICNHCPYVKAIRARLVDDMRELMAAGIGVVAISSNDAQAYPADSFERMADTAREWALPFPYLYDESQSVARAYGAVCTPDFFGYDAAGSLCYRGRLDEAAMGERKPGMRRELVEAMLAIAAGAPAATAQVPSMGCSIKWKRG